MSLWEQEWRAFARGKRPILISLVRLSGGGGSGGKVGARTSLNREQVCRSYRAWKRIGGSYRHGALTELFKLARDQNGCVEHNSGEWKRVSANRESMQDEFANGRSS